MQGSTGLILAAAYGHTEIIELLMAAGASHEAVNTYGNTPLIAACCNSHAGVTSALLKFPGIDITVKNKEGNTALHCANNTHGATECARLLKDFKLEEDGVCGNTAPTPTTPLTPGQRPAQPSRQPPPLPPLPGPPPHVLKLAGAVAAGAGGDPSDDPDSGVYSSIYDSIPSSVPAVPPRIPVTAAPNNADDYEIPVAGGQDSTVYAVYAGSGGGDDVYGIPDDDSNGSDLDNTSFNDDYEVPVAGGGQGGTVYAGLQGGTMYGGSGGDDVYGIPDDDSDGGDGSEIDL